MTQIHTFMQERKPKPLPDYVVDYNFSDDLPELSETAINEANSVFEKPVEFYGGYLMEMLYKKNEVLTNKTIQHLMWVISGLK